MDPRAPAKTPRARAAPPPPTPLDDELIQWDATPQESDEYASNPASDLAGFVHALSGDDHHHDRRSCGLANMLGSEAETAPPDEPPPSTWDDGPRRRGASRPPLAENTVPLKRGAPSVSSQSPARRPPPSKVSRASDAALDAAFLEFDLAAAAPPSKPPPPRPRPLAPVARRPPAPVARRPPAPPRPLPPRPRPPARGSLEAAYAGGFHPGAQGEAAPRAVPARPPAPRSQGPRGPPTVVRGPPAARGPPRPAAATAAPRPPVPRSQPVARGPPRPTAATAPPRPPAPARDSLDAAFLAFDLPAAAAPAPPKPRPPASRGPPVQRGPPRGPLPPRPTAAPPRPRPQPQPPQQAPATGRTSLDAALLGFDLDGAVAEARAAVQTKRCRIVSVQGRGDALITVDGATRRLRLTGDWARAELRNGARGHLVPWAAVGETGEMPQSLPDDITIDQASPYFWVACPEVFVSPTAVVAATACERRAWLTSTGGSSGGSSKPAALGAAKHACFERIARGERDAGGIVRDALSTKASELFAAGVDDRDARKECSAFVQGVLRDTELVKRINNAATEQPLWSSALGLYGVADAVVEDNVTGRTPLELKTGRGHVDHEAQAALYVAMLRGLDANWARGSHGKAGLLVRYGAKDPKPLVTPVRCSRRELTTLLAARNVVAAAIETHNADALTETAPAVLGDGRGACARCYQSEACALRHACVEGGSAETFLGVSRDDRPSKAVDAWAAVEKLDDAAKEYYRRWSALIDVEAASAPPDGARAVVTKRPEERRGDACAVLQKVGETLRDDGVIVECSGASPFSVGDCVLLSAEGDLPVILARGGVVSVEADKLSIILRGSSAKPLPSTLRIDGDGGATSARSQKAALTELLTSDNDVRDLIISYREPAFDAQLGQKWLARVFDDQAWAPPRWGGPGTAASLLSRDFSQLNEEQRSACHKALSAKDYCLVRGMPGAGKTQTAAFLVRALIAGGSRVLVASHAHAAVDHLLEKVLESGVSRRCVVRVASSSSSRRVASTLRDRVVQGDTVGSIRAQLGAARVVGATCLCCARDGVLLQAAPFDVVLVDEAAQVHQLHAVAACLRAARFVLIGDPHQLAPVVRSAYGRENGASESLFQRLASRHPSSVATLRTQYRMNAPVMDLCNVVLHDGDRRKSWATAQQLVCGSHEVSEARLALTESSEGGWVADVLKEPVAFVDVPPSATQSARNTNEASVVSTLVDALHKRGLDLREVAVLTPFRAQLRELKRVLPADVELSTIDRFQGKDAACVLVSFARADASSGLLADPRRLNVALSRARRMLILVGAREALASASPLFAQLVGAVPVVVAST